MSSTKKIKGIYLRGNIYWFTHGTGKGRLQVSLETSDDCRFAPITSALHVLAFSAQN